MTREQWAETYKKISRVLNFVMVVMFIGLVIEIDNNKMTNIFVQLFLTSFALGLISWGGKVWATKKMWRVTNEKVAEGLGVGYMIMGTIGIVIIIGQLFI